MNNNFETILIVFKNPRWPQEFIIKKFSHRYIVETIFISKESRIDEKQFVGTFFSKGSQEID